MDNRFNRQGIDGGKKIIKWINNLISILFINIGNGYPEYGQNHNNLRAFQ